MTNRQTVEFHGGPMHGELRDIPEDSDRQSIQTVSLDNADLDGPIPVRKGWYSRVTSTSGEKTQLFEWDGYDAQGATHD